MGRVIFQCPGPAGKGVLVAPTVHGNLIVGPNAEPVEGEDTATTADGLRYVRETAEKSVPAIDFRQSIRNFAGVRAHADGDDFIIGEAAGAPGFFDLAGICSPGLSAAPAMAEYLVELLGKRGWSWRKRPILSARGAESAFMSSTVRRKPHWWSKIPPTDVSSAAVRPFPRAKFWMPFTPPFPPLGGRR